jgi:hypothetical protein
MDFSSNLPGAEIEGLYSLEAGAEALKLAMRVFWYVDSRPGGLSWADPSGADADPEPSALPYRRVMLVTGETPATGEGA